METYFIVKNKLYKICSQLLIEKKKRQDDSFSVL